MDKDEVDGDDGYVQEIVLHLDVVLSRWTRLKVDLQTVFSIIPSAKGGDKSYASPSAGPDGKF